MRKDRNFQSTFRQLALALLNATLMLALMLAVVVLLTLGRVQSLADDARMTLNDVLAPQAERLERIATAVELMEVELAEKNCGAELREEVAGLRKDIAATRGEIRAAGQIGPQLLAERITQVISDWLARRADRS